MFYEVWDEASFHDAHPHCLSWTVAHAVLRWVTQENIPYHACDGIHLPNTNSCLSVPSFFVVAVLTCVHRLGTQSSQGLFPLKPSFVDNRQILRVSTHEPWVFGFQLSVPQDKWYYNTMRYWTFHCDDIFTLQKAMTSKLPGTITEMRTLPPYQTSWRSSQYMIIAMWPMFKEMHL